MEGLEANLPVMNGLEFEFSELDLSSIDPLNPDEFISEWIGQQILYGTGSRRPSASVWPW